MRAAIDITPNGFNVTVPDDLTKQDVQDIIMGIRDLLINYVNARSIEKALDNRR
jgi:hypothetical protein